MSEWWYPDPKTGRRVFTEKYLLKKGRCCHHGCRHCPWKKPKMIAYISGHLNITDDEFVEHYADKIIQAVKDGHNFVVGDARGVDATAQLFIAGLVGSKSPRVTVYHMFDSPRKNLASNKPAGGFKTDEERDAAMTAASDYDIAWVRPGREDSGTAKNLERRKKQ